MRWRPRGDLTWGRLHWVGDSMLVQGETVRTNGVLRGERRVLRRVLPCVLAGCCLFFLTGCGADADDADRATAPVADSSAAAPADDAETSAVDTIRQAAVAQNTAETERASAAIRQAIEQVSAPYGETVSVTYLPVGTPAGIVSVNGATQHASASMIKLVVLAALFDMVAAGEIDLAAQVEVKASDIVSGTGTVQDDGPGTYELQELARRMIADSDNTATNVIVDLIGMDAVNEEASKLGLTGTVMARKMMDMVAADQGMRNRMTSDDAATILNLIASGKLVNEQMSELAMSFLLQQTINAGLTDAIPAGVQVAHKTGELIQAEHDGGIVLAAHPYVLVVMTEGIDNYLGVSVIADVSRAVYVATNGTEGVEQANATAQGVQDAINAAGGAQYAFDYDEPGVFFTPDYSYDGDADYGWSDGVLGGSGETGGTATPSESTQPGTGVGTGGSTTGGETGGTVPEPGSGGATGGEGSGETGGAGAGSGSEGAGGSEGTGGTGGSGGAAEAPDPGAGDSGSTGGSEGGAGETGGSSTDTAEGE